MYLWKDIQGPKLIKNLWAELEAKSWLSRAAASPAPLMGR